MCRSGGPRCSVTRIVRGKDGVGADRRVISDLCNVENAKNVLEDLQSVVHLAGRAHVLRETEVDPVGAFQRANVAATLSLAKAAARAGVRRFVFVSSIGVNGNETHGQPFTESDVQTHRALRSIEAAG